MFDLGNVIIDRSGQSHDCCNRIIKYMKRTKIIKYTLLTILFHSTDTDGTVVVADVAVVGYAAETVGYVETAAAAAAAVVVGTAGNAAGGYAVE